MNHLVKLFERLRSRSTVQLLALGSCLLGPLHLSGCGEGTKLEPGAPGEPMTDTERVEREQMVSRTILDRGVDDPRVLEALRRVPRHLFVPRIYRDRAYEDRALPIDHEQTISQPYIVALMSEALELEFDGERRPKVLEVGTGSGYQAAVLAEMGAEVYTIEIVDELARRAERLLDELDYEHVHVRSGDGYRGWPEQAPFDAVIVTAAPPEIPEPLKRQLAEGGRLVVPVGDSIQDLVRLTRHGDEYEREFLAAVRFVPMTGEVREPASED